MSRVGKKPIVIPNGVTATVNDTSITVSGPKGILTWKYASDMKVTVDQGVITVQILHETKKSSAIWGTTRAHIQNMVTGVTEGFSKSLEINGVGFKVALQGNKLELKVGFSHPVIFELPKDISATVEKNVITVSGIDKEHVGQTAAEIRSIKKPEPYKGKGIKYTDEVIRRKEGKVIKSAA